MISHANVLANLRGIDRGFQHGPDSVYVSWLPHFHDLGLVGGILQPLYHGCLDVLLSPTAFVQRPARWLRAISEYRGTHTNSPNYGYDLCVRRTTAGEREGLDLSSLVVALNGAEPVRHTTLEEFASLFEPYGFKRNVFYPAYGLAEATLVVSGGYKGEGPLTRTLDAAALERDQVAPANEKQESRTLVGCGQGLPDTRVLIVDPSSRQPCEPNEVGEIWVSGPGVAKGYWKREEDTHETFVAGPIEESDEVYLRTGDLGFVADNELYVAGRLKDLIIVRGANHYPQDIEWSVERAHPGFRPGCGAAFAIERDGEECVVITHELERSYLRNPATDEIGKAAVRAVSSEHELRVEAVVLLKTGSVPRTSSGKIQRRMCHKRFMEGTLDVVGTYFPSESESAFVEVGTTDRPVTTIKDQQNETPEPAEVNGLIHWLREYADKRLNSRLMDERRSIAPHVVLDFGNHGLLGLQTPPELGGLGLNNRETTRVLMQLGAIDQTLAMMVIVHNTLGIRPILRSAPAATVERLVPRLASGRELVAFALTEPQAGSNPHRVLGLPRHRSAPVFGVWMERKAGVVPPAGRV